jgi:hypothetical protein
MKERGGRKKSTQLSILKNPEPLDEFLAEAWPRVPIRKGPLARVGVA